MAKYIAHSSINENGKVSNGAPGDQTAKEVCIRTWYNKPWGHVLRINNETVRKQFANDMIDIAKNDKIGYCQTHRNSLLTQAVKVNFDFTKITTACECDCSSAITVAILAAIYKVLGQSEYDKAYAVLYAASNCRTTSTLRGALTNLGMITVYTSSTYIAGTSNAAFGDIYLKEGSHVVCYIDDGNKVSVSAQNNASANTSASSSASNLYDSWIANLQTELNSQGFRDSSGNKLAVDGIDGSKTLSACPTVKRGAKGNITKLIQQRLNSVGFSLTLDGDFGTKTYNAIVTFQKNRGLTQDGIVGKNTWTWLLKGTKM